MIFDGNVARHVDVVNVDADPTLQWVVLTLESEVRAGVSAQLILDFTGKLSSSQAGFCRAKAPPGGAFEFYAFTQLAVGCHHDLRFC